MDSILKLLIFMVKKLALHENGVEFRGSANWTLWRGITSRKIKLYLRSDRFGSCQGGSLWVSWVYTCTVYMYSCCLTSQSSSVQFLYSTEVTNQKPRNLLLRQRQTRRQTENVVLKFILGWVCTILPSRFQFKFEKKKPQLGSREHAKKWSVTFLTGEGINTQDRHWDTDSYGTKRIL